jgi:hypothetical protein
MNAPAKKKAAPEAPKKNVLLIHPQEGKSDDRILSEIGMSAVMGNAATTRTYLVGSFGELDINEVSAVMHEKAEKVRAGDMSEVEATLTAQAATLDAIFNELARRAALNLGTHLPATEAYLRQALKAQAQCRSTLETLAEIKSPRAVAFVKQANIAHGHQQINNGAQVAGALPAHGEKTIQSNELTGADHELLEDTRASQAQSRVNPAMGTLEAINRAKDGGGESC